MCIGGLKPYHMQYPTEVTICKQTNTAKLNFLACNNPDFKIKF